MSLSCTFIISKLCLAKLHVPNKIEGLKIISPKDLIYDFHLKEIFLSIISMVHEQCPKTNSNGLNPKDSWADLHYANNNSL